MRIFNPLEMDKNHDPLNINPLNSKYTIFGHDYSFRMEWPDFFLTTCETMLDLTGGLKIRAARRMLRRVMPNEKAPWPGGQGGEAF